MDSLKGRPSRKKMFTNRISSDMMKAYVERNLEGKTNFTEFLPKVDPAYKALFHNEIINVWGFDRKEVMEESFFVEVLSELQKENLRRGF